MEEKYNFPPVAAVDASFMLAFLMPDEKFPYADKVVDAYVDRKVKLLSSPLLPYEIINSLRSAVIQKRITQQAGDVLLRNFLYLAIVLLPIDMTALYALAIKKSISSYDASYLWIAETNHIPLLTLDKTLSRLSS
jgi:predicted nucleic acid-binding protein